MQIERIRLPSALRRGRLAVDPVWRVRLPGGDVWQFQRQKAAKRFVADGGCHHNANQWCKFCDGHVVSRGTETP